MTETNESDHSSKQTHIDPFRELNRYEGSDKEYRSAEVYEPPRRTAVHGWKKFHATHDCGSDNVVFTEDRAGGISSSPKYDYDIWCRKCGFKLDEDQVLFIGGQWYTEVGWKTYRRPLDDLHIPSHRVLELGPNPSKEKLKEVLNLGRIEREGSNLISFLYGQERVYECEDCSNETLLTYDGYCRMCYDGTWTNRMQEEVNAFGIQVRERNDSYSHRLDRQITPSLPRDTISNGAILWRRNTKTDYPKLVEVTKRLKNRDTGEKVYILTPVGGTNTHTYTQDEIDEVFYSTGIHNRSEQNALEDDRISEIFENATK